MNEILLALISGAGAGGVAWGVMQADVRWLKKSVAALHARVDALFIALAQGGHIDAGAAAHLARRHSNQDRKGQPEFRNEQG